MNSDKLDSIWSEQSNLETGLNQDQALQLVRRARIRDTRRKIRLGFFGCNLTIATVLAVWATVSGKSHLAESWPATVSLLTLWATYIEFIRLRMSAAARYKLLSRDIRSALRLTLDQAVVAAREIKILIAVNVLTVIPMTAASVQNLIRGNKMTSEQALSFAILCSIVFGANLLFLSIHYFASLRPRCDLLRKRVESLEP